MELETPAASRPAIPNSSATSCSAALTAGVSLSVFLYALDAFAVATARSYAFAALVFCELFRALVLVKRRQSPSGSLAICRNCWRS